MRTWVADLTGLVIGFALGGAGLVHFLPQIEALLQPAGTMRRRHRHRMQHGGGGAAADRHRAAPASWPRRPSRRRSLRSCSRCRRPAPMPQIIEPDEADPSCPPPARGTGMAGTGFFVADGLVMTAAHVVPECRRAEIVSPFVRRSPAQVEARDTRHDIALLERGGRAGAGDAGDRPPDRVRRAGVRAGLSRHRRAADRRRKPGACWKTTSCRASRPPLTDPREQVWMEAGRVTHGYSGGPIFDPRSGKVVGIVRAGLDGSKLQAIRGMPETGMTIGPGSALLDAFLENAAPGTDAFPADQWGDDPLTVVRHATVHVFCWH